MEFGHQIAKRIRELRVSKELTQEALAEKAGIDPSFLGRIERGKSSNLQINTLEKIINALEIDYPTFFSFDDAPDRKTVIYSKLALSQNQEDLLDVIERIIELDEK